MILASSVPGDKVKKRVQVEKIDLSKGSSWVKKRGSG
jgi:hypothetical protein